eukprot:1134246-Pelagomonas_calceolata.AAC.6
MLDSNQHTFRKDPTVSAETDSSIQKAVVRGKHQQSVSVSVLKDLAYVFHGGIKVQSTSHACPQQRGCDMEKYTYPVHQGVRFSSSLPAFGKQSSLSAGFNRGAE